MELKLILGKNIKIYRYKKGYTQEKLAEILDVSTNYIGRLERGQHNPSLEKIAKIAKILEVEPYLLFIENDKLDKLAVRVNLTSSNK